MEKCKISSKCGGCLYMGVEYQKQLDEKTNYIKDLMQNKGLNVRVNDTIGMKNPYHYRNKGKYAFKNGKMGFYEEGSHKIIYDECLIQNQVINEIADFIYNLVKKNNISFYNEDTKKGFLRHIVVRYGEFTNEVMVIFVTTNGKMYKREEIINKLIERYPNIKSIVQNINDEDTNAILGNRTIKLYGSDFIVDKINDLKFKISPQSFYQVNPIQMKQLYEIAIKYANLNRNEVAYDLYSGIGTISLCIAKKVKKVYGIEIVKDAVKDATKNARINKINNAKFISGKVEEVLPKLCLKENADVIFVDPPRSGLDKKTIQTILNVEPQKVIYISCGPESLVQNLLELRKKYNIEKIQPVDMFPFTKHVECVVMLQIKNTRQ